MNFSPGALLSVIFLNTTPTATLREANNATLTFCDHSTRTHVYLLPQKTILTGSVTLKILCSIWWQNIQGSSLFLECRASPCSRWNQSQPHHEVTTLYNFHEAARDYSKVRDPNLINYFYKVTWIFYSEYKTGTQCVYKIGQLLLREWSLWRQWASGKTGKTWSTITERHWADSHYIINGL